MYMNNTCMILGHVGRAGRHATIYANEVYSVDVDVSVGLCVARTSADGGGGVRQEAPLQVFDDAQERRVGRLS